MINMGEVVLAGVREVAKDSRRQVILRFRGHFKDLGFTAAEIGSHWCVMKGLLAVE